MSQHDLQDAIGMHFTQISAIERGLWANPSLEVLVRLVRGMGTTAGELVARVSYDDGQPLSPRAKAKGCARRASG
jgi:transcriptional regulator with XRE-family HTH domain